MARGICFECGDLPVPCVLVRSADRVSEIDDAPRDLSQLQAAVASAPSEKGATITLRNAERNPRRVIRNFHRNPLRQVCREAGRVRAPANG